METPAGEEIKGKVKDRKIRLLVATDAACPVTARSTIMRATAEGFLVGKLLPVMSEEPHKLIALVRMTARRTLAPHLERTAKEYQPAIGTFRAVSIQPMKHTSNREEWEIGGVSILQQVIESGVNVTVGDHRLDNVTRRKSLVPSSMGLGNLAQELRGYRRRNQPRFFEVTV